MEKRIKERYSPAILADVMGRYGIPEERISLLDGFESYIYEFNDDQGDYVLRIGHSSRRSPDLIKGEVDWINYLARNDVGAAGALESLGGNLVEEVDDLHGGLFLATKFVKAPGGPPDWQGWGPDFLRDYGQLIGRMHRLSKRYRVPDPAWKRLEWDHPINLDLESWLPETEQVANEKFNQLKSYLDTLPRDEESYGMIHQDAHGGNFFVDQSGKITLFDFDDCCYGWYAYDLAMVLFYALVGRTSPDAYTSNFMLPFLEGYRQENQIDAYWLAQIPYFLKLREIDLYATIHRSADVENLEHPWDIMYMDGRKQKIENDVPFVNFDFSTLA
ncbi:phosphotransferase enzyme family protein [Chloroflexota bacterium]